MTSHTLLEGPELLPKSGTVKRIVVFLHGVGADGNDLLSIAEMLDLPDTYFFSPHAPFPYDMAPFGRQWFSLMDRTPAHMLAGIEVATPILNATIEALLTRFSLSPSQLALVGFSQGSMMSLYAAPRMAKPLAGVVGICGALLAPETLASEIISRPEICIIHGVEDSVVPFAAMEQARSTLHALGVPVAAHARPGMGHGIDMPSIDIISAFLTRVLI